MAVQLVVDKRRIHTVKKSALPFALRSTLTANVDVG